jgi:hypothetical protein
MLYKHNKPNKEVDCIKRHYIEILYLYFIKYDLYIYKISNIKAII